MNEHPTRPLEAPPSLDRLLQSPTAVALIGRHGRETTVEAARLLLAGHRESWRSSTEGAAAAFDEGAFCAELRERLEKATQPSLRPVFNLTGTVVHTNLGRALLPEEAAEALALMARSACTLEYDLEAGGRGERDDHIERALCGLTGAEAATAVNNNAAAVFITLNTLAHGLVVLVSRGELIEIGGSFRLPDIMAASGALLREVGATNRTHLKDFSGAIGPETVMIMKAHASNYVIQGFTASVPEPDLAELAKARGVLFVNDLGSGSLVDMTRFGLPKEPTVAEAVDAGADLVLFSGDKLLGGPQCGLIAGRPDLIARINRNPLKRTMRLDKLRIAALEAVLALYRNPDRLAERLPTLRLLTRPLEEISALALAILPALEAALGGLGAVAIEPCVSQIGSGALPAERLESRCLAVRPVDKALSLDRIASAFRALPTPVIGRIEDNAFRLDLRCLEDEAAFVAQLGGLGLSDSALDQGILGGSSRADHAR